MRKKILTLVYPLTGTHILLGLKKKRLGIGKWNGFGGGMEEGESIEGTAVRELYEESSLRADIGDLEKVGLFDFVYKKSGEEDQLHEVHVFFLHTWSGEPLESDEMSPQWFLRSEVPYEDMWEDDMHWLSRVLLGEKLTGCFIFNDFKITELELKTRN